MMTVTTMTEGASITYRIGESGRWLLYRGPFAVASGEIVSSQAIRLGWKPSQVTSVICP
jgi:hypothetical protein